MASFVNNTTITLPVATASVIEANHVVKIGANASAEQVSTLADDSALGVAVHASTATQSSPITVHVFNNGAKMKAVAGGAIDPAMQRKLTVDASGRMIVATQSSQKVYGYAVSKTDNADEIVTFIVNK